MSFLDWIFGKKEKIAKRTDIRFGKYTDAFKTADQLGYWEKSRNSFEEKSFYESCKSLLSYMYDENENNIRYKENENGLSFELIQGSKKVTGKFDDSGLEAQVIIAKANALNIGLLRRIIDQNQNLTYSHYALSPENEIVMRFSTHALDGSPYKTFYGLKEIASHGDKQDDLLLHDFDILEIVDETLRLPIADEEKEAKYQYAQSTIKKTFDRIEQSKINLDQQPKIASFLYLEAVYKMEYLINPEGFLMDIFEKAQAQYFQKDSKNLQQKNVQLRKTLQQIAEMSKEDFFKELYKTNATFGVSQAVSHDTFVQHLDSETPQIDWALRSGHQELGIAICGNIVGFCLMNSTLPKPDKALAHLFYEIFEEDFFKNLGIDNQYANAENTLNEQNIKAALDAIIEENKLQYPNFKPSIQTLNFDDKASFARSFLLMMRALDLTKV
jgi:hypothetical protein